jgi:2-phosphoglycerate kinase
MLEYSGLSYDEVIRALGFNTESALAKLEQTHGKKIGRRVEVLKRYWEMAGKKEVVEPLIFVIGGMPCVGKSTFSALLAQAAGMKIVIGGDGFRSILREFISKDNKAFFVSVYKAWEEFGEFNKENVIKGFDAQAGTLNNAIERLVVDRGIRDGESMSVDFLHFLPSKWYKETLNHPSVLSAVLYVDDETKWEGYMKERVKNAHLKGGWERLVESIDTYKIMRDYQIEDAKKNNIPIVKTDNFEEARDQLLDLLVAKAENLMKIKKYEFEHPMLGKIKTERKEGVK